MATRIKNATKVEICLFKPTGYSDTFVVFHDHRGITAKDALAFYTRGEDEFVNYITCTVITEIEAGLLFRSKRVKFIKSSYGGPQTQEEVVIRCISILEAAEHSDLS